MVEGGGDNRGMGTGGGGRSTGHGGGRGSLTLSAPIIHANSNSQERSAYQEYLDSEQVSENDRSIQGTVFQFGRYALLKFGLIALSYPFETVRLLRQVQYGGRDGSALEGAASRKMPEGMEMVEEEEGITSNSDREHFHHQLDQQRQQYEEYLQRSQTALLGRIYASSSSNPEGHAATSTPMEIKAPPARDALGYLMEQSRNDSVRPASQWPLLLDKRAPLWRSVGTVSRRQGLFTLWQGSLAHWTHEVLMDFGKATLEEALESSKALQSILPSVDSILLGRGEDELIMQPALLSGLAQGIMGVLLSPIEMARLRLTLQSVWVSERKYSGLWNALCGMVMEEGGLATLFRHPFLAFTQHFLTPVLRILPISLLSHLYTPSEETSLPLSLAWLFLQNVATCIPLMITLPLETIRRRLLTQATSSVDLAHPRLRPYIPRVPTSAMPYGGAWNCLRRVVREEGISALYQGWGFKVATTTVSFAMALLSELEGESLPFDDEDPDGF